MYPLDTTDRLLAQLLALMANVNRDRRRHPAPFAVAEFLPDPFAPSPAEQRAMASKVMGSFEANYRDAKGQVN